MTERLMTGWLVSGCGPPRDSRHVRSVRRSPNLLAVILALVIGNACSKGGDSGNQVFPTAPTPPAGSQWSSFSELQLTPNPATVGAYVQIWLSYRSPRPLCHEYVKKIKNPNGVVSQTRTARSCDASTSGQGGFFTDFKVDMPGPFEVTIEAYEYDPNGDMNPDAPVTRTATVIGG